METKGISTLACQLTPEEDCLRKLKPPSLPYLEFASIHLLPFTV